MFFIDPMSRTPIYEQLIEQVERFVLTGVLKGGDPLPSVRGLSVELSVNPNTIQKAYSELDSRGVLLSVPGRGCFVAGDAAARLTARAAERLGELDELVARLALAGVPQEAVLTRVQAIYKEKGGCRHD